MNKHAVETARLEAHRFLQKIADLKDADHNSPGAYGHSKQAAALRRSSMDLTRALADLRRVER